MIKQIFLDVETTGVDQEKHAINQVSFGIYIDGELKEFHDLKMQPFEGALIEQIALDTQGIKIEDFAGLQLQSYQFRVFKQILERHVGKYNKQDKAFFYAYNADFDNKFIRKWFERNGDSFYGSMFWTPHICVMQMAAQHLLHERGKLENFKLVTVCKYMGIEVDETRLHDAKYDIELTKFLYDKLQLK